MARVPTATSYQDTANITSHAFTVPSGVVAGDALYLQIVYAGGSTTVTSVSGLSFTPVAARATQTGHSQYIYRLDNAAGTESGATVTVVTSTALKVSGAVVLVPQAANPSIDGFTSTTFAAGTSHTAPSSPATTAAGDYVLSFMSDSRGASTPNTLSWTQPSGYTRIAQASTATSNGGASSAAVAYDVTTLPASGTVVSPGVWTTDQSALGSAWTITIFAGAAPSPQTNPASVSGMSWSGVQGQSASVAPTANPAGVAGVSWSGVQASSTTNVTNAASVGSWLATTPVPSVDSVTVIPGNGPMAVTWSGVQAQSAAALANPGTVGGASFAGVNGQSAVGVTNAASVSGLVWGGVQAQGSATTPNAAIPSSTAWAGVTGRSIANVSSPAAPAAATWAGVQAQSYTATVNPAGPASTVWAGVSAQGVAATPCAASSAGAAWSGVAAQSFSVTTTPNPAGSSTVLWAGVNAVGQTDANGYANPAALTWGGITGSVLSEGVASPAPTGDFWSGIRATSVSDSLIGYGPIAMAWAGVDADVTADVPPPPVVYDLALSAVLAPQTYRFTAVLAEQT